MRLFTPHMLFVSVAMLAASGQAMASETRQATTEVPAPNDSILGHMDRFEDADIDGANAALHAQRVQKIKPASNTPAPASTPAHTANDNRVMPSRFHSFLPGMFR
jgi:hypothetical protein